MRTNLYHTKFRKRPYKLWTFPYPKNRKAVGLPAYNWSELTQASQLRDRYTVEVQNRFEILQGRVSVKTVTN